MVAIFKVEIYRHFKYTSINPNTPLVTSDHRGITVASRTG